MTVVLLVAKEKLAELRALLRAGSFKLEERPHALFLAKREGVTLTAYASGKVLLTGPQGEEYALVLTMKGIATTKGQGPGAKGQGRPLAPGPSLVMQFDGLCMPFNPGGVATFGFHVDRAGKPLHEGHGLAAPPGPGATNNVAEYAGLLAGLQWLLDHGHAAERILVRGDSQLVVEQMSGKKRVHAAHLKPLHEKAKALLQDFADITVEWVPREQNARADKLSEDGYANALAKHPEWRGLKRPLAASTRPPGAPRPATWKQLDYLRALGVTPPQGLTVAEASKLIDEAKAKREP